MSWLGVGIAADRAYRRKRRRQPNFWTGRRSPRRRTVGFFGVGKPMKPRKRRHR